MALAWTAVVRGLPGQDDEGLSDNDKERAIIIINSMPDAKAERIIEYLRDPASPLIGRMMQVKDVLASKTVLSVEFALGTLLVSIPLPPCVYQKELQLSGTVTVHSGVPSKLERWQSFAKDASSWANDKACTLLVGQSATLERADAALLQDGAFKVVDEAGLYSYWDNVLNPSLSALWSRGLLGVQPTLSKGALDKGMSDRGVCFPASKVIVPVEIKHRFALLPGKSPFSIYKEPTEGQSKSAQQKHVEQIYGYLCNNGLNYGILCTDEDYYFLKLEAGTLYYSDAIKRVHQVQPSVISAICYITHLALQQPGPAGTNAGGGTGGGGGWEFQKIFSWLAAFLTVQLQLLYTWLRLKGPSAPQTVKSRSLNLGRRLGNGITGVVYHGISPLGRQLAIKVPSREGRRKQGTELQLQQLDNEVSVYQEGLRELQGSVVPTLEMHGTMVTDAGDDIPFLATEFLEGGVPLSELSAEQWPSTLAADVNASLAAVHARGVALCDVRPEHLFLMPDGTVKMVDFGHARMGPAAGPEDMARDLQDLGNLLAELQPREQELLGQPACEVLMSSTGDSSHRGVGVSAAAGARPLHLSAGRATTSHTHNIRLLRAPGNVNRAGRVRSSLRLG